MWELFSVRAIEGSDPQENALHSQACPPPTLSTAAPKKLTVQAGKLKYRICCTRSDRGDVQLDLLKAQVSFWGKQWALWRRESVWERREGGTKCWDPQMSSKWAAVLSAGPLAFDLQSKLSPVVICLWDVNLYFSSSVLHNFSAILPGGPGVGKLVLWRAS